MDYFAHQERARRATRLLLVFFALAVVAIVVVVNLVLGAIYLGVVAPHGAWASEGLAALPRHFVATNTAVVLLMIVGGTLLQTLELREGGPAVARMIGARAVDATTANLLERRLLNVVEEMALAAGVAVPQVHVLDRQPSINAFVAGYSPNAASLVVTRGALTRITREELQGIVGHEFSHLLNGDMALNLRLVGVVHGLLMLAMFGRFLVGAGQSTARSPTGEGGIPLYPLVVTGGVIWVVGYIGLVAGRLIKAGVSRSREFLADAGSVQFTRNPDGIGGALRRIGGLESAGDGGILHPHAETLSHLFIAPSRPVFGRGLFATHPALAERVRRVYGRPMDFLPAPERELELALERAIEAPPPPLPPLEFALEAPGGAALVLDTVARHVGSLAPLNRRRDASDAAIAAARLRAAVSERGQARLVVLALLVDQEADVRERQHRIIADALGGVAADDVVRLQLRVRELRPGNRLPLVDHAAQALRRLDAAAREQLLDIARRLVAADGRTTLPEFLLYTVLERRIGIYASRPAAVRYRSLAVVARESSLLLALIATVRLPQDPRRAYDAGAGLLAADESTSFVAEAVTLRAVAAALSRLNRLAPLLKPRLIVACTAAAFVDGATSWKAASCLRTFCAAIDCPVPPRVIAAEEA